MRIFRRNNEAISIAFLDVITCGFGAIILLLMIAKFGEDVLGKGIVHAKDTPNFVGNRIGGYGLIITVNLAVEQGLTVEEVDKLTGTICGRPKSATFRTADVVGLDTM